MLSLKLFLFQKIRSPPQFFEGISLSFKLSYLVLEFLGESLSSHLLGFELLFKHFDHGFLLTKRLSDQLVQLHINLITSPDHL